MTTEIIGKNISMRLLKIADVPSIVKTAKSADVGRFTLIPYPATTENMEKYVKRSRQTARKGTDIVFGIVPTTETEVIGVMGVHGISAHHKKAEIGYWLGKKYRGRGYMKEAIILILSYCYNELKLHRVQATTMLDNENSQFLLKKFSFRYEATHRSFFRHRGRSHDVHMYALTVQDYREMRRKK